MATIRHLGAFPFCIREFAEDGKPFEEWDQETLFSDMPSKTSNEEVTVYGSGTRHFIGPLTLDELMFFYWKPKTYRISIDGEYSFSVDSVFNSYGYWDNNQNWVPVQYTVPALNATFSWPANATDGVIGIDEYDRRVDEGFGGKFYTSEKDLVCPPIPFSNDPFPFFVIGMSDDGSIFNADPNSPSFNFMGFFVNLTCEFHYQDAVKTQDGEYYLSISPVSNNTSPLIAVGYAGTRVQYSANPDSGFPITNEETIQTREIAGYFFPSWSDAKDLHDEEIKIAINFPSGPKDFYTKTFINNVNPLPSGWERIPTPQLNISISFDELWEYNP